MSKPRYFAIFGTMRTGSNLLERTLDSHDGLVGLGELFNSQFIGGPWDQEAFGVSIAQRNLDPAGFLEAVIRAHPGQVPGFRIFEDHDQRMIDHAARDPACARFVLTRDPLDSYLSLKIARLTNQWMVRKAENRKLAKVEFDAAEFTEYETLINAHYQRVRGLMRAAGQPWFEIAYEDLNDLGALNGAAAYAGSDERKDRAAPRILRQNPPLARDKVTNPDDLDAFLAERRGGRSATPPPPPLAPDFSALRSFFVARGLEVVCAPIPGVGDEALRAFLSEAQGAAGQYGQDFVDGLKPKQIARRRARGAFVFSFVRRPADRIRAVFQRFVRDGDAPDNLSGLQALLRNGYGADGTDGGDFDAFLNFIDDNLAGRTAAPYHPAWAPQADLLAAYAAETPVDFIGRAERVAEDAKYVLARLGLADHTLVAALAESFAQPLTPQLTPEREARIRAVFAVDYERLGYKPGR